MCLLGLISTSTASLLSNDALPDPSNGVLDQLDSFHDDMAAAAGPSSLLAVGLESPDEEDLDARFLAAASGEAVLHADYSVLGVLVMTLGLIIVVEVVRHYLDHLSKQRPFFLATLTSVYTELSTLGMVELVVWLLHSYYDNLNVAREQVFAKVHFTLFYTALLNAFQSVLLARAAMSVSRRLWVQTELLELNHYVELREEFDRVHAQLGLDHVDDEEQEHDKPQQRERNSTPQRQQYTTLSFGSYVWSLLRLWIDNRLHPSHADKSLHHYPLLHRKYRRLLVQVRFHELRVQFLQAYKLPMALKISNYLWRSQLHVLIGLVHVNMTAWLLLTLLANILFVGTGLLLYETQDSALVGRVMTYIFVSCLVGFVLMALWMHRKMERIFDCIMTHKDLWETTSQDKETVDDDDDKKNGGSVAKEVDSDDSPTNGTDEVLEKIGQITMDATTQPKKEHSGQQLELFWFSDPTVVIALVQFMQFGYALALSIVIIFADVIADGVFALHWYLVMILVSYVVFVLVVARIIPRYTLCTSLGQLVDSKRLHETVAEFHLDEAKLKQREEQELRKFHDRVIQVDRMKDTATGMDQTVTTDSLGSLSNADKMVGSSDSVLSSAVAGTTSLVKSRQMTYVDESDSRVKRHDAAIIAEMVKLDTAQLRTNLPASEQQQLTSRDDRRRRRKSMSEGVGAMARIKSVSETVGVFARLGRSNSNRSLDGAGSMGPGHTRDDADINVPRKTFYSMAAMDLQADDTTPERLRSRFAEDRDRRRGRRKSVSDGVALMAKLQCDEGEDDQAPAPPTKDELRELGRSLSMRHDPNPFGEHRSHAHSLQAQSSSFTGGSEHAFATNLPLSGDHHMSSRLSGHGFISPSDQFPAATISFASVSGPIPISGSHVPTEQNMSAHNSVSQSAHDHSGRDDVDADDFSIKSDGARSDVDDIPDVVVKHIPDENASQQRRTWRQVLQTYFLSKRFVVISNVFGTMAAFFFVGERIASFLFSEGITDPTEVISFHFNNTINFWMLFGLLCLFLASTVLIMYSLGPFGRLQTNKERIIYISALIDVFLSSTCLTLFTIAEVQRCCTEDADYAPGIAPANEYDVSPVHYTPERGLAGETYVEVAPEPPSCSCPAFGSRLYGGLGSIEPYVSIVGLRILRFWLAKRIVLALEASFSPATDASETRKRQGLSLDPLAMAMAGDETSPMTEEKGSIAELWETAVSRYPHIVAKHGEFSGELLQAMLGVSTSLPVDEKALDTVDNHQSAEAAAYEINEQYKGLSTRAQEIIMSGALGRTMKATSSVPRLTGFHSSSVIHEGIEVDSCRFGETTYFEAASPFDVSFGYDGRFECPEACLVRSMRRCDRKLLPMLDRWISVDVVMTRFEIVYFDIDGVDTRNGNLEAEDIREALAATRGGKGIRLCDIAAGRRVVGQMSLADIASIHVEREMPHQSPDDSVELASDETHQTEYWYTVESPNHSHENTNRRSIWSSIKQDILVIHSRDGGKLLLRYYADLTDAREHPEHWVMENETEGPLFKDNAFQWAQCLGRYCGREQLKQALPHLGEDTDDELRDYLVVKLDDARGSRYRKIGGRETLRRMKSFRHHRRQKTGELPPLSDIEATVHSMGDVQQPVPKPAKLTAAARSVSMDELMSNIRPSPFRRMLSIGSSGLAKSQDSSVSAELARTPQEAEDDAYFRQTPSAPFRLENP